MAMSDLYPCKFKTSNCDNMGTNQHMVWTTIIGTPYHYQYLFLQA